jgi:prolyl-tRNA editing enzyme YbaK/EbsC (Cys-tRNA(Pro) deacylase)
MEMKLGNFVIVPALNKPDLLAPTTVQLLTKLPNNEEVGVTEIDPSLSDTASFCEKYNIAPDITANCVIVEAKRGESKKLAACVVLATTRADVNGLVRRTLDARKASFAPMETAVQESGMEYGAINPIGLPEGWPILIDSRIVELPAVVIGSGVRKSKIILPGKILATLPNAQVIEGLGQVR